MKFITGVSDNKTLRCWHTAEWWVCVCGTPLCTPMWQVYYTLVW